jgi:hypothetical protein
MLTVQHTASLTLEVFLTFIGLGKRKVEGSVFFNVNRVA